MVRRKCPTPYKQGYSCKRVALLVAGRMEDRARITGPRYTYKCRCGNWHVTHRPQTGRWRGRR